MDRRAENSGRRAFLTGRVRAQQHPAPLPPGVTVTSLAACTACSACVAACPEGILGLAGRRVSIDFAAGECTFCGACADVCPEPVFTTPRVMSHVAAVTDACLARRGVTCMACRDVCPEQAVSFVPRIGGPFLPEVRTEACTGCGACIAACPVGAIAAEPIGVRGPTDA